MELNQTIPSFVGGVSQQTPVLRLPSQSELEINTHATISDGLQKRPNTDFVKNLGAVGGVNFKMFRINRDVTEKYIGLLTVDPTNPVRVYDLAGTEKTITYGRFTDEDNTVFVEDSNIKGYLSTWMTNPKRQFKCVTVADYTFIVNTTKTVLRNPWFRTAARAETAWVWFKARYKGPMSIILKWTEGGSSQTATMVYENNSDSTGTSYLPTTFVALNPAPTKFAMSATGSLLTINPIGGAIDQGSLSVSTTDSGGDLGLVPISRCTVSRLDKLPNVLYADAKLQVGGDIGQAQDDFYMQYTDATRSWHESVGFDLEHLIDASTMPHCLIRQANGTFRFAQMWWASRAVGDEDSNPFPSFVGETISNIGFSKNRLWLLSRDNLIGSKAGEYFDFFASTVMNVEDDDPIDVAGASEQVNLLRSMKIFNKGLMVFSDERQFAFAGGDQNLTPKTVALDETTSLACDPNTEPVKLGSDIYFVSPRTDYISVREYMVMPDTLINDAPDITSHVPKFIKSGDILLEGCNTLDTLFLHTSGDPTSLYVHNFMWSENKKVMQAWRKWAFEKTIVGFQAFNTLLYILFYDATNGYSLHVIRLENTSLAGDGFRLNLDGLTKLTGGTYGGGNTTYVIPYNSGADAAQYQLVNASTLAEYAFQWSISGTVLTVVGADVSGQPFYFGKRYTAQYRFGRPYIRKEDGAGVPDGNLLWRRLSLHFKDTGYFKVVVTAPDRTDVHEPAMSGVKISESVIGGVTLLSGEQEFPIHMGQNDVTVEIQSDSYLPFFIPTGIKKFSYTVKGKTVQ